jgi:selenium metabolism protein YedF
MKIYDTVGQSCPKPLIVTKEAIENERDDFLVICGSENSKNSIIEFLDTNIISYELECIDNNFHIKITPKQIQIENSLSKKVMLFTSNTIGKDEKLGEKLAKGFITTLASTDTIPSKIFFVNSGVKLTTSDDSEIIESLTNLALLGVEIYSCGLCLEYYGLSSELKVGKVGNALDTLNSMLDSTNSITVG